MRLSVIYHICAPASINPARVAVAARTAEVIRMFRRVATRLRECGIKSLGPLITIALPTLRYGTWQR